jgi:acyl-CoA synthetase (AMP-forming)/AMP-acid ligase II
MSRVRQMLFSYLAEKNAKYHPQKTFIVDEVKRCTFDEFNRRTNALARGLLSRGLRAGDRVVVLNHNALENVETFFGVMKAGGVAVPINVRLTASEVGEILRDAEPALIVAGRNYLDRIPDPEKKAGRIFGIQEGGHPFPVYESLIRGFSRERIGGETDDDETAMLIYTSGTTGKPKGVMWSHRNLFSSAQASAISRLTKADDVALLAAPIYQAAGVGTLFSSTFRGNTVVLINRFEPGNYLALIARERITTAFVVPAMLLKLLECPDIERMDLGSMRTICYGSAPMPVEPLKQTIKKFGWTFMGACGATETSPGYIAFLNAEDHFLDGSPRMEKHLHSIGKESINAEVRIFDEHDRELPANEIGEIVIRGTNIMKGYWRKPAETAETLRQGWYHTGDLGYIDEEGYIYIVDRKKDLLISGGFNVYPKEIENALGAHPAVLESAVVGKPDPQWGETPVAFVVRRKEAAPVSVPELLDFLRERIAGYKLPKGGVFFIDDLPRNAAGKVMKQVLRERVRKG